MTGYGKRGKPKAGFPSFPTALGNRKRRHSNSPGEARNCGKPYSRFPTFPLVVYFSRKGGPALASLRFRLIVRLENASIVLSHVSCKMSLKLEFVSNTE